MLLNLNNVSFSYNSGTDYALHGVTLAINSNLVTGLAGANGSGKTTLINEKSKRQSRKD